MKRIQTIELGRLRQEEAFGFHSLIMKEFAKCTEPQFAEVLSAYKVNLAQFDEALKPAGASALTKKITDLDYARDNAYNGIVAQVKNTLKHFNPSKVEAARTLEIVFNKYENPTELPYIQENGVLDNIIQDLEKSDAVTAIRTIDGSDWMNELKRAHTEFVLLFSDRNNETAGMVTGASQQSRKNTDTAYKACVVRMNALAELQGFDAYAEVINNVNKQIDYEKTVLAARLTRSSKKEKAEA